MLACRCRGGFLAAALFFVVATATASDHFVSPAGSPSGDGSLGNPWDLKTALAHPNSVSPTDTIHLLGGVYQPSSGLVFVSRLSGAPGRRITVRAHERERVQIDGGLEIHGSWSTFRDLEIFSSSPVRQTGQSGSHPTNIHRPTGIVVVAANVQLINNIVHDAAQGIGAWSSGANTEIYGNHLYFNGWKGPNRTHGHGVYAQNETGSKWLKDNIVHDQFADGLHIYGSSAASLNGFNLQGNAVFNNSSLAFAGWYTRNILLGGGAQVRNAVLDRNFSYFPPANGTGDVNLGYWPGGSGCTNVSVTNNYFVSGGRFAVHDCGFSRMTGNTIVGDVVELDPSRYPSNAYQGGSRPNGPQVFVRPNLYEAGRATVVIYNWNRSPTVAVNLAGIGLAPGDRYELHNAQDYFNDVVTGTYTGAPIQAPMMGRSVAKPVGWSSPPSTFPEFGVFIVRKTGGVSDAKPPTVTLLQPQIGSTLSGSVQLSASAADNVAVAGVEFQGNGQRIGEEDLAAPYSTTLDTREIPDGPYTLAAVARDQAGNVAQSTLVSVVIQNGGPAQPATSAPALIAPGPAVRLGPTVNFRWQDNGTEVLTWQLKGGPTRSSAATFNSRALAAGTRSFRATNIPQNGQTFWVHLRYRTASGWKGVHLKYTTKTANTSPTGSNPAAARAPALTAPGPAVRLGRTVNFRWQDNGTEVLTWHLKGGPTRSSAATFNSRALAAGTRSFRATNIPQNGQPFWVHLRYRTASGWKGVHLKYATNTANTSPTASNPTVSAPPAANAPAVFGPGLKQKLTQITRFYWRHNGANVISWQLKGGPVKNSGSTFNSGVLGPETKTYVAVGLPQDGRNFWIQLRYRTPAGWKAIDYQYSTRDTSPAPGVAPRRPVMTAPAAGARPRGTANFLWAGRGTAVTAWRLKIGSRRGRGDFFNSGLLSAEVTGRQATNLPRRSQRLWVRLEYRTRAGWRHIDRQYIASQW